MRKVITWIVIFIAVGTLITIAGLTLVENFIYSLDQTSSIMTGTSNTQSELKKNASIVLPENTEIQYSYNNKYYTYLENGKIYINSLENGENVDIIEEESPICYFNLLYDKNMIIYFTSTENTNISTRLALNTYEIDTKRKSEYNKFNVNNFSRIKDMHMSPIINIIYINVETKSATYTNNIIYRVDLFNSMAQVRSGVIVENLIMLQQRDRIYYQDTKSNVYYSGGYLNLFKNDVDLIGIDEDDNLYFMEKEQKQIIYKVSSNKIIDTIELSDTDVITTYCNNYGVYVIYPTYVVDISADNPYKRVGKFSKYVKFEAIKGNTMYLRTVNNNLVTTKLIEE